MLQTPLMWAHYQEALEQNPELSFTDFLDFHTSEDDHERGGDREHEEDVPCHHHHAIQFTAPVFVAQEPAQISLDIFEPETLICFGESLRIQPSFYQGSVWNPPRMA